MNCTRCGQPLQPGHAFCPRCGQPAAAAVPAAPPGRPPQPGVPWAGQPPAAASAAAAAPAPRRRPTWPLLAVAVAVLAALAAAWFLVLPRFLGGEDELGDMQGVVPPQPKAPVGALRLNSVLPPVWPGAVHAADAGLVLLPTPELDDSYGATPVWKAVEARDLASGRTLWAADLGRSVCALGRPGALLCLDGSQARTYDLRTGASRTLGALGPLPGRLLSYPDGFFVTLSWTPPPGTGSAASVSPRSFALTGYDAGARQRWSRTLLASATGDDPMLGRLAGDVVVYARGQDRLSATLQLTWLAYLRDPATGEPLPGVQEGVAATALPGRRLLVRTAAGFDVLDARGRAVASAAESASATMTYLVDDGSVPAFVVEQPDASSWTVHGLDGSRWSTAERPVAVCGGVVVTAPQQPAGAKASGVRIARDATGAEKWRLTLPIAPDRYSRVLCDGQRVIESDAGTVVAYASGGLAWTAAVAGADGASLLGVRHGGIVLETLVGDVHVDVVALRQE